MPATILLADDEASVRAIVRATLGSGYRLLEASNGIEALALASAETPEVILLDVNMPRLDGLSVCRRVKAAPHTSACQVIMLTGQASTIDERKAHEAGADGFLAKPFSPLALLAAVRRATESAGLEQSLPSSSEPAERSAMPRYGLGRVPAATGPELEQILAYARELSALHDAAQRQAAHFRRLVEIGRDLVSAQGLDAMLGLALERATSLGYYDSASVLLADGSDGPLDVRATFGPHGISPRPGPERVTHVAATRAATDRLPIAVTAQEISAPPAGSGPSPDALCLPLITPGGDAIGVLLMAGANSAQPFDAHQLDVLQLLAAQLAASVESVHLHEELHDLIGRLLVAQEEERRRVAYDVHDSLAQVAASTHQHLQALARHYRPRTAVARAELTQALELALRTVRETRRVIADLRPTVLDDFGLATALRLEVGGLRASGWDIDYEDGLGEQRLDPSIETALFRIAQEALTNVRKHAQTTRVHVALRRTDQVLRLEVRDWGWGFRSGEPHPATAPGEKIGLRGMQERMALLGGRCTVRSRPGAGTQVVAEIAM